MTKKKIFSRVGIVLFAFGVLLGMALTAVTVWADLEASFFDADLASRGGEALKTLRCPVLMTTSEVGVARVTHENTLDKPIDLRFRAHITEGFVTLVREVNATMSLEPGEEETVEFYLTADDVTYNWLILVRVLQFRYYPLPSRQASCGVMVLDVPFLTGGQLLALTIVVMLLSLLGGIALRAAGNWPMNRPTVASTRTMGALTVSLLIGFVVGAMGSWLIATLLFAINLLLIFEIVRHAVDRA